MGYDARQHGVRKQTPAGVAVTWKRDRAGMVASVMADLVMVDTAVARPDRRCGAGWARSAAQHGGGGDLGPLAVLARGPCHSQRAAMLLAVLETRERRSTPP